MSDTDLNNNDPIDREEYKKVTEAMYKQNLELARLYKEVDSLNKELGTANDNLKTLIKQRESLMHLINHKVKGAFTHSKYIFAGMLDGTFGELSPEIKSIAEKGLESDNGGILTIDLILNAANLSNGTIKYEMKDVDFKEVVESSLESKKSAIEAKGLVLVNNIEEGKYKVVGDVFWLKEVVNNLIENSIRYTREGQITVGLQAVEGKVRFFVKDTGIGMSEEDKKVLFTEGGRGVDSVKINTDSTGYGLYSVKLIVDAHKGRVWGESEGPGKGSTFYLELSAAE